MFVPEDLEAGALVQIAYDPSVAIVYRQLLREADVVRLEPGES